MNYKHLTEEERKQSKQRRNHRYYENNKKKIIIEVKKYRKKHKEILQKYSKNYYQTHKKEINTNHKNYRENHRKEMSKYIVNRLKTDINFKLAHNLRNRLRKALHRNQKSGSAVGDLGCSISALKTYLESKFQEGMAWENWSKTGWHIDHIIPLDSFNLQNREEFLKACHYTNLQPLWAEENITKGNNLL
jgi:uncharacterized membrane protein YheB (UPF0754 family)